jgi:uncharacterized membrane protein (UPF0127 family)
MRLIILLSVALAFTASIARAEEWTSPQPVLPKSLLVIETKSGPVQFFVELADTPETRARGLMFRRHVTANAGMLFDFRSTRDVSFWMKNTLAPLDMIFIRADGRVARIAANTVPRSTESVPSGAPVAAVLEIAGGRADAAGIKSGDLVRHAIFKNVAPK